MRMSSDDDDKVVAAQRFRFGNLRAQMAPIPRFETLSSGESTATRLCPVFGGGAMLNVTLLVGLLGSSLWVAAALQGMADRRSVR